MAIALSTAVKAAAAVVVHGRDVKIHKNNRVFSSIGSNHNKHHGNG